MRYLQFALILVLAAFCSATTNLAPVCSGSKPEEDEKRLWHRAAEEQRVLDSSGHVYKDEGLLDYLNEIAKKLQPPEVPERMRFKIVVLKNPYLNAFAFPNGVLYIHTGILARMDNEAQLAALLGHEMAHCTHRHALKTLRHLKGKKSFLDNIPETLCGFRGIRDLRTLLGSIGLKAAVSGYSQELEAEADRAGLELMVNAGYDPNEALRLFEHLKRELEEERIEEPFFLGTHPRLEERVDNCEKFLKTQGKAGPKGLKNEDIFISKLHNVLLDNAWLDLRIGRFHIAQKSVEKYLKIRPDDASAYYLMGEIWRQRGKEEDTKKAKGYYKKAISAERSFAEPYKAIGLIYYKEGKKRLAKDYFEMALSLSPHRPDKAYILEYLRQCNQQTGIE